MLAGEGLDGVAGADGGGGTVTVNGCVPLVPLDVVTVTVLAPATAAELITKLAVIDVVLFATILLNVTPLPLIFGEVPLITKLEPLNVTGTVVP
jgi:hypothetical protein